MRSDPLSEPSIICKGLGRPILLVSLVLELVPHFWWGSPEKEQTSTSVFEPMAFWTCLEGWLPTKPEITDYPVNQESYQGVILNVQYPEPVGMNETP